MQIKRRNGVGNLDTHCKETMIALPNKLCSGHLKATEEDGDPGIPGEEI